MNTLALALTPSPGEREQRCTLREFLNDSRFANRLRIILPLPLGRGEGRGEGKNWPTTFA